MGSRDDKQRAKFSDLLTVFNLFDRDQSGFLHETGILAALKSLGFHKSHGDLRQALENCEVDFTQKRINFREFKRLYQEFCKQEASGSVDPQSARTTIYQYGSSISPQGDDTLHSVSEDEQVAFCGWLERNLCEDEMCQEYFPFKENGDDLYEKCSDGKIINCSAPQTIDLRALHRGKRLTTYQVMENITLALNSARAIGCNVVNIGAADIVDGTRHLLLGLLWQIIKIGLLRQINVVAHSELVALLDEDETITEFAKLAPEQILMRWVNYHLKRADCGARMENFTIDVKDCEVYAYLLEQISPPEKKPFLHSSKAILDAVDLVQRAEMVLQNAEKLNCRVFVQPKDIINGSMKLNLAFLANLFNTNPALEPPTPQRAPVIEETREEKSEEEPQPPPSRWECLLAWLKALLPQAPQTTRVPCAWFRANYDLLEGRNTKITGKYLAE
ncbi:Fimbrin [Taenia solium]|eukprot:TsM_000791400 transcript=TsM_000791400 gene=TsM_000791400